MTSINETKADEMAASEKPAAAVTASEAKTGGRRTRNATLEATGAPAPQVSKLDRLTTLLSRPDGASLAEMVEATGWQAHSVRGAMAGALRKRGHAVASAKGEDGVRRYRIGSAA